MRLKTIEIDGRTVAYQDVGHGTPVILAHCSSASHKEWRALCGTLQDGYRVVAPDLIGYGESAPWPADQPFDPLTDVNALLGLVTRTGGQVHLAGHSYGAATALEAARLLGPRVKSLTLVEPVAFHLLRLAGRAVEWDEIATVARRVRTAVAEGRPRRAAATYMSFWIGRLRWWLMAPRIRQGIVSTVAKVAAEFGIMQQLTTTLADYAGIIAPTRFVVGGRTRRPARAVTDVLLELLPDAHLRVVPDAGHMSPFTHTTTVNSLIVEHIASCERRSPARRGDGWTGETADEVDARLAD